MLLLCSYAFFVISAFIITLEEIIQLCQNALLFGGSCAELVFLKKFYRIMNYWEMFWQTLGVILPDL